MKQCLLLSMCLMTILGCGVNPPIEGRLDPYAPPQINFASKALRNLTAVQPPRFARDDSGLLFVEVPIRADTNKRLYVDYRTTFLDQNGQTIYQTGWFTKTLEPYVADSIQVNSVSPRAADFEMDLRFAE